MPDMTPFAKLTKPQQRQIIAGFAADSTPLAVTMRDGSEHRLILQGVAQDERTEADPFSDRGSLIVARHYLTPTLIVLRAVDIASLELHALPITDPRHPNYEAPTMVTTPIPVDAMASRRRGGTNRHEQP